MYILHGHVFVMDERVAFVSSTRFLDSEVGRSDLDGILVYKLFMTHVTVARWQTKCCTWVVRWFA